MPLWLEIAFPLVLTFGGVFAYIWFVEWRPGKYDAIVRVVRDGNGHGLHVFGQKRHVMDEGSYSSVTHVFIRKRDGKAFKTAFCEWSGSSQAGSMRPEWGHRFEEAWSGGVWRATLQTLAKKSGLALSLHPTANDDTPIPAGLTTVKQMRALL
ncbi:MAG TPA: hypothetical protein VM261_30660 [Kofleriaceae bacterium]|nr:hypothetical protein [Kofleriaceae bacterium]